MIFFLINIKIKVVENKKTFFNNKSGSKLRLSYLNKHPNILKEIIDWVETYNLYELSLREQIYHYVNDLKKLPIDNNGLRKTFYGFSKGYSVHGKKENLFAIKELNLESIISNRELQIKGGSISQKILNNASLLKQLNEKYNSNLSLRAKIYMFVNDIKEIPKCKICGLDSKFGNSRGFLLTCSNKCRRSLEASYRSGHYKMKDGRIVRTQGYENYVLEELEKMYNSSNILVGDEIYRKFQVIKYSGNKEYYPDILIQTENRIIEVKSSYTYNKDYDKNQLKKEASLLAGFKFNFYIWDKKQII